MYDKTGAIIIDRREMLRVKIKSLAAEAQIIRKETSRLSGRKRHQAKRNYTLTIKLLREMVMSEEQRKAAIIETRTEFRKAKANARPRPWGVLHTEMHEHRIKELRRAARSAHVAYGIIRGRSLEKIETAPKVDPDWKEIERLVKKYGPPRGMELPDRVKAALAAK